MFFLKIVSIWDCSFKNEENLEKISEGIFTLELVQFRLI